VPKLTVFFMGSPELEMPVAFPCVVDAIPICDLCEEWPRILCQRMKSQAIDGNQESLLHVRNHHAPPLSEETHIEDNGCSCRAEQSKDKSYDADTMRDNG
jgi:hypothetical protein